MSEPAGIESLPEICSVCRATSDETTQLLGTCIDTIACVRRYAGIVQRQRVKATGTSGSDLELRIQQEKESREQ